MALKKTLLIAGAVTSIGMAGASIGARAVSAESGDTTGPMSGLVSKIANKFNLNEDDVQAVFDEHRTEAEAERRTKVEEKLTQAVADGKLTEEQKTAILEKMEELRAQREKTFEELKNMTPEERQTAMEQHRNDLDVWAKEQNIPEEFLRFVGPGHGGKFMIKGEGAVEHRAF